MSQDASRSGSRRRFSTREIEVLELASQGMTNPQIASRLELSVHAIKFHLASIYRKLGAANRTEAAVAWALTTNGHAQNGEGLSSTPPAA
jgi:DNA-binding NarL/FixJ family response regulator